MSSGAQRPGPLRFGVATADHQCEAFDARVADIRDDWERAVGQTLRGRATDFWDRYAEDVELARSLGCKAFRFSVAWSRVEPEAGRYDDAAFDHYATVVRAIRDAGMVPVLTLLHFTWPKHVEGRGGLADSGFPELFRAYAAEVARRIGADVGYWITINEPNLVPFGYIRFWWQRNYGMPPGLADTPEPDQVATSVRVIRNLFLAHTAGRAAIREVHPSAKVSANPYLLGLPGWYQKLSDWFLARQADPERWKARESRLAITRSRNQGRADVTLASLALTPERERKALFSESYEAARPAFLVEGSVGASDLAGLARARVAVVRGALQETLLPRVLPGATPVPVADRLAMLDALDQTRADAAFDDDVAFSAIVNGRPGPYRMIDSGLPAEAFAAAVGLKNRDLLDVVDLAVRQFKESGEWTVSRERHLPGLPAGRPPSMKVRASLMAPAGSNPDGPTLRAIRRRGYVVVAVEDRSPGFSVVNPRTGERRGLEIDLARAISRAIFGASDRVRFVSTTAADRLPALVSWADELLDPIRRLLGTFSTLFNTNWWHLGMAGRLPEFLCPASCVGQQDYVGLDYYWGIGTFEIGRIIRLIDSTGQRYGEAPVYPAALLRMLRDRAGMFPGQEIVIVENGCVAEADGVDRATYIRQHVAEVERARDEGLPVSTYICWSITTNREWGLPLSPASDFGLYRIDLDGDPGLTRIPTPSTAVLASLAGGSAPVGAGNPAPAIVGSARPPATAATALEPVQPFPEERT